MMLNRTADRNVAINALAFAATSVFRHRKHSRSKHKFMEYEIALPNKHKGPGTSFALLPNVRLLRAVSANAAPGEKEGGKGGKRQPVSCFVWFSRWHTGCMPLLAHIISSSAMVGVSHRGRGNLLLLQTPLHMPGYHLLSVLLVSSCCGKPAYGFIGKLAYGKQ
jgi:hypothetical protein